MKIIAINKHSAKLKIWGVEMPNAPYSNRSSQSFLRSDQLERVGNKSHVLTSLPSVGQSGTWYIRNTGKIGTPISPALLISPTRCAQCKKKEKQE